MSLKFRIESIKRKLKALPDDKKQQVLGLNDNTCPNEYIIYVLDDDLLNRVGLLEKLEGEL